MKKNLSVLFCVVMLLSVMTGCGRSSQNDVKPGDADTNRPGVNDSVVNGNEGMVDDSGMADDSNMADPTPTDGSITDDMENGVENAGDAVKRGMDNVGKAAEDMMSR